MSYLQNYGPRGQRTPQQQPVPGAGQARNNAGGYAWEIDAWSRLDRFLILGNEGGTYYVKEHELTRQNAQCVERCIAGDGQRTVARIVELSETGRAPKNDAALFALALAASVGDQETRRAAWGVLPRVARTGTHLFHFVAFCEQLRGWGRGLRKAVAGWYAGLPVDELAYQVIKYQQRDRWSHRDLLRLAHPNPESAQRNNLYQWVVKGGAEPGSEPGSDSWPPLIWAFERARRATSTQEICRLIEDHNLPREAIPTHWLNERSVWEALLQRMPLEAMTRSLAKLTVVGLLDRSGPATSLVCERLQDQERVRRARLHPLKLLAALITYQKGRGERGKLSWQPIKAIVSALNDAFYLAFDNVQSSGRQLLLALDVSGSMAVGRVGGVPGLTPRLASAAMALITAAKERYQLVAFSHQLEPVDISTQRQLNDVLAIIQRIPMGRTDCSLPMLWAQQHCPEVEAFIVYTDNETWYGDIHPAQALRQYRERTGIAARLAVVGMTATQFSIADPNDPGMLDFVGFDTAAPAIMSDFVAGGL